MARNPDPKPGRWILPLIIIGMIAFTYVFVNNLDDSASATPVTVPATTATTSDIEPIDVDPTVAEDDPTLQAYVDQVATSQSDLTTLVAEMESINEQWDNREVEFAAARNFLRDDLNPRIDQWATRVGAFEAPAEFTEPQLAMATAAAAVNNAAVAVLDGLEAPDTGEARRAALEEFLQAVADFDAAAAGVS